MIKKIISGGQTGADRAALDVAIKLGIPHSGWIPKGRKTEDGPLPERYNLQEMPTASYSKRTEKNVLESDGTLILTHDKLSGGSKLTKTYADKHGRPCLHINLIETMAYKALPEIVDWISDNRIKVLNVAGPKASEEPSIYEATYNVLNAVRWLLVVQSMGDDGTVPTTVNDAVDELIESLSFKDKTIIAGMDEDEILSLNISLGTYIRNKFCMWSGDSKLMEECRFVLENSREVHVDNASSLIIRELWLNLKKTHRLRVVK